jgi:hypothetical protein
MSTKEWAQSRIEFFRDMMLEVHTCLPAKIKSYDSSTQKAEIEPLLKTKYKNEDKAVDLPVINNVPVQWQSANNGSAFIHLPLKAGDLGIILFSERSLDTWLSGEGASVSPDDPRHHHISDAIFIPGVRPFKTALPVVSSTSLFVKNGDAEVELTGDGNINIVGGNIKIDAATVIDALATTINLGSGSEKAVLGDTLSTLYALHTHVSALPGSPTSIPSNVLTSALSTKVNLD